jgi:exopolysaccharide production protein ExoZ
MEQDRLPGLQIARAIAALSIAYFHSWHVTMSFPPGTSYPIPLLKDYGWVAVDFFFAISGFVICLVVTRPNFNPLRFIVRRAFRLYPLWIATSLIYLWLTDFLGRSAIQTDAFFAYSLTLLPTEGFPFYDLGWSLQHELAFYALAAMIAPRFGLPGLVAFLAAGISLDRFVTLPWYLHQFASYYPNFLAGIAAYLAYPYLKRFGTLIPIAAGFGLLYLFTSLLGRAAFPIGIFFVLVGLVNIKLDPNSISERIGVSLGDASYSIYLMHPLVFLYVYIELQPPLPPIWTQEIIRFGCLGIICGLAIISWKFFETPMNRLGATLVASLASPKLRRGTSST